MKNQQLLSGDGGVDNDSQTNPTLPPISTMIDEPETPIRRPTTTMTSIQQQEATTPKAGTTTRTTRLQYHAGKEDEDVGGGGAEPSSSEVTAEISAMMMLPTMSSNENEETPHYHGRREGIEMSRRMGTTNNRPIKDWFKKKLLHHVHTNNTEFGDIVDDALQSLNGYNNEHYFPTTSSSNSKSSSPSSSTKKETVHTKHDWILDGHDAWNEQYQRTESLLSKLHEDPLHHLFCGDAVERDTKNGNRPKAAQPNYNSTEEKNGPNDGDEKLLLLFGSVGNQEFQFAAFDDAFPAVPEERREEEEEEEEEFSEYQDVKEEKSTTSFFNDISDNDEKEQRSEALVEGTVKVNDGDDDIDDNNVKNTSIVDDDDKETPGSVAIVPQDEGGSQDGDTSTYMAQTLGMDKLGGELAEDGNGSGGKKTSAAIISALEKPNKSMVSSEGDEEENKDPQQQEDDDQDDGRIIEEHEKNQETSMSMLRGEANNELVPQQPQTENKQSQELSPQPHSRKSPASPQHQQKQKQHQRGQGIFREKKQSLIDDSSASNDDEDDDENENDAGAVSSPKDDTKEMTAANAACTPTPERDDDDDLPSSTNGKSQKEHVGEDSSKDSSSSSTDGSPNTKDSSTKNSVPSMIEWMITTTTPSASNKLSSKVGEILLSSPSMPSKSIVTTSSMPLSNNRNLVRTPVKFGTPGSFAVSPDDTDNSQHNNLTLRTELASPEGRFLRRRSSQPLYFDDKNGDADENIHGYDEDTMEDELSDSRAAASTSTRSAVLDVSDLSIPALFFFDDKIPTGSANTRHKRSSAYFDDSHYLTSLEWDWWPWVLQDDALYYAGNENDDASQKNDGKVVLLQDEITQQLSQLDTWHRSICRRIYEHVAPHAKPLQKANQAALDLTKNYQICQMYMDRCRDSLQKARYGNVTSRKAKKEANGNECDDSCNEQIMGGVQGARELLQTWNKKESYTELQAVLKYIQYILNFESSLVQRIQQYDIRLPMALDECKSILMDIQWLQEQLLLRGENECVDDGDHHDPNEHLLHKLDATMNRPFPSIANCNALDDMKKRVQSEHSAYLVDRLHSWMELLTVSLEYDAGDNDNEFALSRTYQWRLLRGFQHVDSPSESVVTTIQTTLLRQAQEAWGYALLDPTPSEENNADEEEYEKELLDVSYTLSKRSSHNTGYAREEEEEDWTSRLMTIRLDWEASSRFPSIYHKLCVLLCRVLYGAYSTYELLSLPSIYEDSSDENCGVNDYARSIGAQLLERRASIWNACIQTLERSLEEYAQYMDKAKDTRKRRKQNLQLQKECEEVEASSNHEKEPSSNSASLWNGGQDDWWDFEEWEGLREIWRLTQQFLTLREEFGVACNDTANDGTCLQERLQTIFKHHLRSVYVEAMNSIGKMLYEEDWTTLVPLASSTSNSDGHVGTTIQKAISKFLMDPCLANQNVESTSVRRSQCNLFCTSQERGTMLSSFREQGNPFHADMSRFQAIEESPCTNQDRFEKSKSHDIEVSPIQQIHNLLEIYCDADLTTTSLSSIHMLPKSFVYGLLPWASRLIRIVWNVPPLAEDSHEVFSSMFSLYTTTVFRMCTGSAQSERVLLQVECEAGDIKRNQSTEAARTDRVKHNEQQQAVPTSPIFGKFRRRSSSSSLSIKSLSKKYLRPSTLSPHLNAEICAPIPKEQKSVASLRDGILQAQQKLEGIVKLDLVDNWVVDPVSLPSGKNSTSYTAGHKSNSQSMVEWACQSARILEKRQIAVWSTVFLATSLYCVGDCLAHCEHFNDQEAQHTYSDSNPGVGPETNRGAPRRVSSSLECFLETYVNSYICSVPGLVSTMNRAACVRAIGGKDVVREIVSVGSGWEESKLHEHPNQYVESLCDLSAFLWCSLSNARKLSTGVLHSTWESIVECGYLSLLDGFSRIPYCSTEGRALMSMDLLSFSSGIRPGSISERLEGHISTALPVDVDLSPSPLTKTTSATIRDMRYVDTYIKVFYFPPQDAVSWIEENFEEYQEPHMVALIVGAATSSSEEDRTNVRLTELVNKVSGLYRQKTLPRKASV